MPPEMPSFGFGTDTVFFGGSALFPPPLHPQNNTALNKTNSIHRGISFSLKEG